MFWKIGDGHLGHVSTHEGEAKPNLMRLVSCKTNSTFFGIRSDAACLRIFRVVSLVIKLCFQLLSIELSETNV